MFRRGFLVHQKLSVRKFPWNSVKVHAWCQLYYIEGFTLAIIIYTKSRAIDHGLCRDNNTSLPMHVYPAHYSYILLWASLLKTFLLLDYQNTL